VRCPTTASATFVLANTGTVAVNIASTSLPSASFTVTSTTCGASLAVAASCNCVVTFAPVAAGAAALLAMDHPGVRLSIAQAPSLRLS
jgi:hypothetical protein